MFGRLWTAVTTPGPKRGTWSHQLGGLAAALIMGLVFYFVRANGG